MGQKVNPHRMRVGVTRDWDSRWYPEEEPRIPSPTVSGSMVGVIKPWEVPKRTIWSKFLGLWYSLKIAIFAITHPSS